MILCCKTPLHDVEYDARMLGMQGEVLKIKDEASMVDFWCFMFFENRERVGRGWRPILESGEARFRVAKLYLFIW
jgi:hypothetical protein